MKQFSFLSILITRPLSLSLVPLIFLSCNFHYAPLNEESKLKPLTIEINARQFVWTVCYSGDDSLFGKKNFRLISETNPLGRDSTDINSKDDFWVTQEFHIPSNREISFLFSSRDVIHSAYLPHFRAQMNCVPGQVTQFSVKPQITTDSMRVVTKDPGFDYVMMCNKICGASHYTMKMKVVVEKEENFNRWWNANKNN